MLKKMTLEEFSRELATRKAAPGGGSVCALAGGLAAALSTMVAEFTLAKEKFTDRKPEMERLRVDTEHLRNQLITAVDRDAQSYREVLAAFRLPKSTEQEETARSVAVQKAFRKATEVPLEVAQYCLDVLQLTEVAVELGNPDMITDAGVGVVLARSAALGALMNAEFNLGSLKDEFLVAELKVKIEEIKEMVANKEEEILRSLVFR
jgi:formiminotetrahydrofolate cyclodeaminase